MARSRGVQTRLMVVLAMVSVLTAWALGNGGPFVVKYPKGDPAAKGVLARLDSSLKPRREVDLKVIKEDLKISFEQQPQRFSSRQSGPPLATVVAEYTIQNPTDKEIKIDFGFPILRGIYISQSGMGFLGRPAVSVRVDGKHVATRIISNSVIYGIIRSQARKVIDKGIAADDRLAKLVGASRPPAQAQQAQPKASAKIDGKAASEALAKYLIETKKWSRRDAALMVAYANLDFGKITSYPRDRRSSWRQERSMRKVMNANLGTLSAIGEQKATQFFAQLARRFDKASAVAYESIFKAWGGDVRERSVDLVTGNIRPREVTMSKDALKKYDRWGGSDPTIYARVEYFDKSAKLTKQQKATCKSVLKNLDVIFTFSPMNLLHYQATFPAKKTLTLTVSYKQYAYIDTAKPASYQLAYVVHPASLWDSFGPIALEVRVPRGVNFRASIPCKKRTQSGAKVAKAKASPDVYEAVLKSKKGELLVAVDKASWHEAFAKPTKAKVSVGSVAVMKK